MSRIGRSPIPVPSGVSVGMEAGTFKAKGPLGELTVAVPRKMKVKIEGDTVLVERRGDSKEDRSMHGLTRSLMNSAVVGVSLGFTKRLEIIGVGYRAELKGSNLVLHLGYSHPITVEPHPGISFEVPEPTKVTVKGAHKQSVGQVAADIRGHRPPEPYKGKGVKYENEVIRRKAGKTAAG